MRSLLCVSGKDGLIRVPSRHKWQYNLRKQGFFDDSDRCVGNTRYLCRACGETRYRWDRNHMAPDLGAMLQGRMAGAVR